MKRKGLFSALLLPLLPLFFGAVAVAQVPQTISYQGVLTNASGVAVSDGNYSLTFKLYDVTSGGSPLWTEAQTVGVSKGIFSVVLGQVNRLSLAFDKQYWLGITVGSGSELSPRLQLTSAAYSLNAQSVADNAVTSSKIADNTVGDADIQDRTVSIVIPAHALGALAPITRGTYGLTWPSGFSHFATGVIAFPSDWDGQSEFKVTLFFMPESNASGVVSFFIRPVGRKVGDALSDPGSIASTGVSVASNSFTKLFSQSFTIPASRFTTSDDIFHFYAIQRGGTGETFADSVTLLSVKISYTAKR